MSNFPICLMYGKEDPWVKPVWALQVKQQVPEAPYYEVSPAGHCPHDEVPEVCSSLLISLMALSVAHPVVHAVKMVFRLIFVCVKKSFFLGISGTSWARVDNCRKTLCDDVLEINTFFWWEVENSNRGRIVVETSMSILIQWG